MRKTNSDILEQIKLDRIESLKIVRESITSNQSPVLENISNVASLISKDEEATKHLTAIIKAKEMIASLMTKATLATTEEELTQVRKSLNYYLNKVKRVIKSRNMSEELYNKYYQSMSYLREDVSECMRVMKRQVKLDKLTANLNSGPLTVETLKELKKCLNNEKRFNKRLLEKYGTSDGVKRKPIKYPVKVAEVKEEEPIIATGEEPIIATEEESVLVTGEGPQLFFKVHGQSSNSGEVKAPFAEETKKHSDDNIDDTFVLLPPARKLDVQYYADFSIDQTVSKDESEYDVLPPTQDVNATLSSTWQSKIKRDYKRYKLETPHEYGDKLVQNVGTLLSNIGIYHRNKGRAKCMMADYHKYCHSESLKRLINYTLYNNSIKGALDQIFRNTALGRYESEKAREHRLYIEEIYEAIDFKEENTDQKLVKSL